MPTAPQLLLDGVIAFSEDQEQRFLMLDPSKLDYESQWTAWRGGRRRT